MNDKQITDTLRGVARHAKRINHQELLAIQEAADRLEELTRPPRVLTWAETLERAKQGRAVYAEGIDGNCAWIALTGADDDEPYIRGYDGDAGEWDGQCINMYTLNGLGEYVPHPFSWRPWDKEPTEEQRRAAPWIRNG